MSIAYLLLVHNQPSHVGRLVRSLMHDNTYFFVHVDKKVSIETFRAALPQSARVIFITHRMRVNWGGWSIVAATLELCRAARSHPEKFSRYQLLSGACYPIKSNDDISNTLLNSDREFISINDKLEPGHRFYRWVAEYHYKDCRSVRFEHLFFRRFLTKYFPRKTGLAFYKGWQWWSPG
ncbi:beta-1,6-N-acetylglucosaminyltransferase [Ferrovum myxofaciens]|uniref:beta-1,6-N-acetylglucosaminyltransferase n=1 Tax=Ferrovum myxofaciens TaxID=416213 RepID=UPI003EBE95F9